MTAARAEKILLAGALVAGWVVFWWRFNTTGGEFWVLPLIIAPIQASAGRRHLAFWAHLPLAAIGWCVLAVGLGYSMGLYPLAGTALFALIPFVAFFFLNQFLAPKSRRTRSWLALGVATHMAARLCLSYAYLLRGLVASGAAHLLTEALFTAIHIAFLMVWSDGEGR